MGDVLEPTIAEMSCEGSQVSQRSLIASKPPYLSTTMIFSWDKFSLLINSGKLTKRQPVAFDSLLALIIQLGYQLLQFFFRLSLIFGLALHTAPLACLIYIGQASEPALFSGDDYG